jgi:hypothetical protein
MFSRRSIMRNGLPRIIVLLAFTLLSGIVFVASAGKRTGAESVFRDEDTPPDRIRSDGAPYEDGPCTASWTEPSGFYFLRTIKSGCPDDRFITLDFTDPVEISSPGVCREVLDPEANESLDICAPNDVTDVRIIANTLFKGGALTTTVSLHFSQKDGGDFTGPAPFELSFEGPVPITGGDSNFRVLEAGADAVAELYQNVQQGKRTIKVSLGRYNMPFQLTVTKQ